MPNVSMSPALTRAMKMFNDIPMGQLPDQALIFCAYMCKKYMGCGEVMLTAYGIYAQIVEGLSCDEEMYAVTDRIREEWDEAQRTLRVQRDAEGEVGRIRVVPH